VEVLQTSALPLGYAAVVLVPPYRYGKKAGDRARTGDPNLGKVVLYQLSYTRQTHTKHEQCYYIKFFSHVNLKSSLARAILGRALSYFMAKL
jgi:hypothetical protein